MNRSVRTLDWRDHNAECLRLALCHLRLRLHRYALRAPPGTPTAVDWIVAGGAGEPPCPSTAKLDGEIAELARALAACEERMRAAGRPAALRMVAELANLGPLETALLLMAAAPAIDGAFALAYAQLQGGSGHGCATLQLALAIELEDSGARLLAHDVLMPARPLRALRLIDAEPDAREPVLTRALSVDERMADYLRGANRIDERVERMLAPPPAAPASASSEQAGHAAAALIAAQPATWMTVNLIGRIGRGAEQAARVACESLGLTPRLLDTARLAALSPPDRAELLALLGRDALLAGIALVVDTRGIQAASEQAAVVDELIATVAATLFIVSAERWPGDRGIATVQVPGPSREEQRQLWCTALNGHATQIECEIDAIVQQFNLGGPAIAGIVERAVRAGLSISAESLWRACREQTGMALDELACRLSPCYGWDDIILPDDVRAQLRELAGQVCQRGRVYERWGFGAQLTRGRGITALFAGTSGTGKTMAAEILAADLALDLYRVDLAGVVSKYIGETEKNLRRVFEAAEHSGAILFFDEADTLFGTRTEVRDSHDRYANLEVNYLLQRMEDYSGLAILATNRRSALDTAFLRRLRCVIEFPFPNADDRRRIWERVFPADAPTERLELACLSRLDLSGGNIRSIAINAAFLAATDGAPIGMTHVMRAAAREYVKLSKPISLGEFGPYNAMVGR
jgi:ATP-dependent 26S proteasome regulatory subunit